MDGRYLESLEVVEGKAGARATAEQAMAENAKGEDPSMAGELHPITYWPAFMGTNYKPQLKDSG